jgi:hypothetical protein
MGAGDTYIYQSQVDELEPKVPKWASSTLSCRSLLIPTTSTRFEGHMDIDFQPAFGFFKSIFFLHWKNPIELPRI